MRRAILTALAVMLTWAAQAQESRVDGWDNLKGREPVVFKAEVVDVLCHLTDECTEKCGSGRRQLGLVREDDGRLILAVKNQEAGFQGASHDLYAYCGMTVTVDGLMVGDPELTDTKVFQVHFIQREGRDAWAPSKRWTRIWRREFPEAAGKKGAWFRNDPRVQAAIEANGYLGLGAEADAKFIEENY